MSAKVRQAVTYVMYTPIRIPTVRSAVTYVIYGNLALPKGVDGKTALFNLIHELTEQELRPEDLIIGAPEVTTENGCNTRIRVTSPLRELEGEVYFYYNRAQMNRLPLPSNFVPSKTDLHLLVPDLTTATGMVLSTSDFVNAPVTAGKVKIEAASTSYFFIPGSVLSL